MIVRSSAARAREGIINTSLLVTTAARHLGEDPLLLALQASRRLPRPALGVVTRLLTRTRAGRSGGRAAVGLWLDGRTEDATRALEEVASGSRRRVGGRFLAELAVQVGRPDLGVALVPVPSGSLRARDAWLRGDLSDAVGHLAGRRAGSGLADRYRTDVDLMRVGSRLSAPHLPSGEQQGGPAAFHVLTNSLPHTQSGYALRSHSVLMAQTAAGIRVTAATRLGYPVSVGALTARHHDTIDDVPYLRVLPPTMPRTTAARLQKQVDLLAPVAARFGPSVLHTTTNYANALVTEALSRSLGVPWVYEVRGLLEETWVASRAAHEQAHAAGSERYRALRAKETEMALAADHVVTLSQTLLTELTSRGVDRDKITVVPNAVDPALLATALDPAAARAAAGLDPTGFWVGTVSSLVDYEGLDTLIDAVAMLRRRGVDARACLVGDGVARGPLERRASDAGVREHVVFTGRVPRDRAPLYHQALDVFVVPRRDVRVCRFVTPLKPIEAMACARPVVASDLPALAELVREPGTGELVPAGDVVALADALESLAGDPARRAELGASGRAFAGTRTWANAGASYRTLYARLTDVTA